MYNYHDKMKKKAYRKYMQMKSKYVGKDNRMAKKGRKIVAYEPLRDATGYKIPKQTRDYLSSIQ